MHLDPVNGAIESQSRSLAQRVLQQLECQPLPCLKEMYTYCLQDSFYGQLSLLRALRPRVWSGVYVDKGEVYLDAVHHLLEVGFISF